MPSTHFIHTYGIHFFCFASLCVMIFEIWIIRHWDTLRNYRHFGIPFGPDYGRITQFTEFHSQHTTYVYSRRVAEPYQRQHLATTSTNDTQFEHFDFAAAATAPYKHMLTHTYISE